MIPAWNTSRPRRGRPPPLLPNLQPVSEATKEKLQEKVRKKIYDAVAWAVSQVIHMEDNWTEGEMIKRIMRYINKASDIEFFCKLPWNEACKQLVERMMHGYTTSCSEAEWFFEIDLVPALCEVAWEFITVGGQSNEVTPVQLQENIVTEYEDKLERVLLDKAMWECSKEFFAHEKLCSKVFQAISRAYWPALDEALDFAYDLT